MKHLQTDAAVLTQVLLASREVGATVCPSEVAKQLAKAEALPGWRDLMPIVHAAIDDLRAENQVCLSWKGKSLATREGPYRIGRAS